MVTWISNFNLTTDLKKVMVQWSETELYSSTDPEEGYKNSATQVSQDHSCIHHSKNGRCLEHELFPEGLLSDSDKLSGLMKPRGF